MTDIRQRNGTPRSAERRQITILFCDVVGSTALSERLDPEDVLRIMRAYYDACRRHITRMGGYVSRTIGDGILVYFGFPTAHEDDPHRALHAALSIISEVRSMRIKTESGRSVSLAVRVSVHTGLVVVGSVRDGTATDQMDVFGQVPNIAARLQELARPNSVIIGSKTHERVDGTFRCRYLGKSNVKGATQPIKTWAVEGVLRKESRFEATRGSQLTPIVGRQDELALLDKLWQRSVQGEGQLVLLSGEPGIGKSRLVRAFREAHAHEAPSVLFYQCSPFHCNTPLHPIIDQVQRAAAFSPGDKPHLLERKLRELLAAAVDSVENVLPVYRALLAVPPLGRRVPVDLGSFKVSTIKEALTRVPTELSRKQPVLMIVEDAQWIDPTSIDVLDILLRKLARLRMLIIVSSREPNVPWHAESSATSIALSNLNRRQTREMVAKMTRGKSLPRDVLHNIIERTDGNPLYVEEFTKTVLESGLLTDMGTRFDVRTSVAALSVPATLQDSLTARLDRLGEAKHTLQNAAVVGRNFPLAVVLALSNTPKEVALQTLGKLEESGLLIKRSGESYSFKHAMIRDAAYDSLLKSERQALHRQIAELIEEVGSRRDAGQIALLAHHFSQAGQTERAIPHWLEAGHIALRHSSYREAIAHFREGINSLRAQPAGAESAQLEIEFLVNLALAYTGVEGWAGPRVGEAYQRARRLTQRHGSLDQKIIVSWGLWVAKLVSSELGKAMVLAEHLIATADESGDRQAQLMANCAAMVSNFFLGRMQSARAHAERVCELYDNDADKGLVWTYHHDPKVVTLVYLGHLLWLLGEPRSARAAAQEARKRAKQLEHPFMMSFALILGASDYLYERDLDKHFACVQRGITIANERGLSMFEAFGPLWSSEAIISRDPSESALEELSVHLDNLLGAGMYLQAPLYQALLASQFSLMGHERRAKALTRSALKLLKQTGEKWFEPELYRIMGEIASSGKRPNRKLAEAHFRKALQRARRMGTVGWELRAARSLAELRRQQGREFRRIVLGVRNKYPPGQSCADLRACEAYLR